MPHEHDHMIDCPACGHQIMMFEPSEPAPLERLGARVADRVTSIWFPVVLAVAIALWVILNVVARPFEPYPMVMIGGLGVGLTTITAFQAPLILLAQRSAAQRDRARDIEAYRVAINSERDLHEIRQRLNQIDEPG